MDPFTAASGLAKLAEVAEVAKDAGGLAGAAKVVSEVAGIAGGLRETVDVMNDVGKMGKAVMEKVQKSKAFEALKDMETPKHISTINEDLVGKTYPGTGVVYEKHKIIVNGEKLEGVFPKFPPRYETVLPKELRTQTDDVQFRYCTQQLAKRIEANPNLASQFTPRQLEQIRDGAPRISGLTWHHNEVPGKMQLVDAKLHDTCRHTGGRSIWGGGTDHR